jgi:hypothetical protein
LPKWARLRLPVERIDLAVKKMGGVPRGKAHRPSGEG